MRTQIVGKEKIHYFVIHSVIVMRGGDSTNSLFFVLNE